MKAANKAALLSAFVFPGIGHFYLKKSWRGLVIMLIFLSGVVFLVWQATSSAMNHLDSLVVKMQSGTTSLQEIAAIAGSQASTKSSYYDAVFYFLACVWIFAVVDAYRIGKRKDIQDKAAPSPTDTKL